jgi:uncharacterized protein YbbC (DUF1343 family)
MPNILISIALLILLGAFPGISDSLDSKTDENQCETVLLGIENLLKNHLSVISGKRVSLLTNPSGVDRNLRSSIDLLYYNPEIDLVALFGPEHGIRGAIHAGEKIDSARDPETGLPVYSLYGDTRKPTKKMMADLDAILVDIQDIGARSYTYIYTMAMVMDAAAHYNKEVIILDRPNPAGGIQVEGNIVQSGYFSFVGLYPIAYRHGMTIGELAKYFNSEFSINCKLIIIPLINWKREMYWGDTGLPWVPTSPHIPHWKTVLFYIATGTFGELHTLSEGVGYTSPFELVGSTWIHAIPYAEALNKLNLPGVIFRPLHFRPYYFRNEGKMHQGVQLHITDHKVFKPFITGLHIMKTTMDMYPEQNLFKYKNRVRMFNKVMGSDSIMNALLAGKTVGEIENDWQEELDNFIAIRKKYLIY